MPLYEVIRGNVHKLYGGMKLTGTTLFRLTRDAEVEIDDESDEALREWCGNRSGSADMNRWSGSNSRPGADAAIREMLRERFELSAADVYDMHDELDYTSLFQIAGLPLPALRDPAWTSAALRRHREQPTTFSLRYGPAMFWCIIPTRASRTAWNISSRRGRRPGNGGRQDDRIPHRR